MVPNNCNLADVPFGNQVHLTANQRTVRYPTPQGGRGHERNTDQQGAFQGHDTPRGSERQPADAEPGDCASDPAKTHREVEGEDVSTRRVGATCREGRTHNDSDDADDEEASDPGSGSAPAVDEGGEGPNKQAKRK